MTKEQIEIFHSISKLLEGKDLNDCNHALAAVITSRIAHCIDPSEYRTNILEVVENYADWFYVHRKEHKNLDYSAISFNQDTCK